MRLIDADALDIEGFREDFTLCECDTGWNAAVRMINDYVKAAPTIEAEPVKHGRWIEVKQPDHYGLRVMQECSCCGTKENWLANYCPNCGAKMDGGAENG